MIFKRSRIRRLLFFWGLLLLSLASACSAASGETPEAAASLPASPSATLRLYHTATVTPAEAASTPQVEPSEPPLPTATPYLYTIVAQDTMLGIAARFNVPLEDLLAANPLVDPRALSVGSQLIIPVEGQEAAQLPSATPVGVAYAEPVCYSDALGGLWCFLLMENQQSTPVENLTALVHLYSNEGELLASQTAAAPINLLAAGQSMPLMTYFEAAPPDWAFAQAQLVTALAVNDQGRYLAVELVDSQIELVDEGLAATVSGELRSSEEQQSAGLVWLLASAFDANGTVVGLRRWESDSPLEAGASLAFELELYSLGAPIDRVALALEARP